MKQPGFISAEKNKKNRILIVDVKGDLGIPLASRLKDEFAVTFVTQETKGVFSKQIELIFVNGKIRFPIIPQAFYEYIFLVIEDEESSILQFLLFAEKVGAKIICIFPIRMAEKISAYLPHFNNPNFSLIVVGDLFGNVSEHVSKISSMIFNASYKNRIILEGEGLDECYPIFLEDAVDGIIETAFMSGNNQEPVFLLQEFSSTLLSIARLLKKINPLLKIDFRKRQCKNIKLHFPKGIYILKKNYELTEKLDKTMISLENSEAREVKRGLVINRGLSYSLLALLFLIASPMLVSLLLFATGAGGLWIAEKYVKEGKFFQAGSKASFSKGSLSLSLSFIKLAKAEAQVVGLEKGIGEMEGEIYNFYELANILEGSSYAMSHFIKKDFIAGAVSLKNSLLLYQKMRAQGSIPTFIKEKMAKIDNVIQMSSATIDFFPYLFGAGEERKYLVLFQNNAELRAGGGFIGSYGILDLEKGKVKSFSIHDVYDADGKLKGHVEPPYGLRRYMGAKHWFLRDSNYDVSYPISATTSAFFLKEETGEDVDGIIAIDLAFVRNLLTVIGNLYVPDYKETITADNLFEKTERQVEKDFFPGSAQKKNFLTSLFLALQEKVLSSSDRSYFSLLEAVNKSLAEKHLLLVVSEPQIQRLFSISNASSALIDEREEKENLINDFIGLNESNVGGNKVNYFVKRKLSAVVKIRENGSVEEELTVFFKNESNKEWANDYKNYLRLILPKGSSISKITIDGKAEKIIPAETNPAKYESKNFKEPVGLEVEEYEEENKKVIGFFMVVPKNSLKTISISYTLPFVIQKSNPLITYSLKFFKQPGIDSIPYSLTLLAPKNSKVIEAVEKLIINGEKISFTKDMVKDTDIFLKLSYY